MSLGRSDAVPLVQTRRLTNFEKFWCNCFEETWTRNFDHLVVQWIWEGQRQTVPLVQTRRLTKILVLLCWCFGLPKVLVLSFERRRPKTPASKIHSAQVWWWLEQSQTLPQYASVLCNVYRFSENLNSLPPVVFKLLHHWIWAVLGLWGKNGAAKWPAYFAKNEVYFYIYRKTKEFILQKRPTRDWNKRPIDHHSKPKECIYENV